jgi:hypothetical protein
MSSRKRDAHFRPGFRMNPLARAEKSGSIKVPGWNARKMAKHQGPLNIGEMLYRTGLKTRKELAQACREGRFPLWRYDRLTGRVLWHRLEFEALMYWQRAKDIRSRAPTG